MFVKGSWKTKVSYFVMGFGNMARRQFLRGLLFLAFEAVFIIYMIFMGASSFSRLTTLGELATVQYLQTVGGIQTPVVKYIDNSFNILLFGVLTIFFVVGLLYTWYLNIQQSYTLDLLQKAEKKIMHDKDDIHALVDQDFYKTLLSLPLIGILVFTILPIFFMVLVAFTNYDKNHFPPTNLFSWVGGSNFQQLFVWSNSGGASFSATFGQILLWTLIWAFFATFTNYFLGMMVAMLINKKGIKLKKLWRTILVFSIAIPQFISLLYVSKMFSSGGLVNIFMRDTFGMTLPFWTDATWARITVIIINIWIGIPYLMLITTGILMNIPADLYESSKIDGASPFQQYMKITLPYMLFVTGPYLLTSFTGNMNNFNVIFLLTGGAPKTGAYYGSAGKTDLLITWLYSLTVDQTNYKLAAVIGILIFVVVAALSLIVYNLIPSTKNEEDFA
ncbi:MAG: sugar ABC transporter permease [Bacilli bacterium]|nr:sugar ABC transporter permease [Bacilli bacterium]